MYSMNVGDDFFDFPPLLLKGIHKYSLEIHELFWDIKMEIYIFGEKKTQQSIAAKL